MYFHMYRRSAHACYSAESHSNRTPTIFLLQKANNSGLLTSHLKKEIG